MGGEGLQSSYMYVSANLTSVRSLCSPEEEIANMYYICNSHCLHIISSLGAQTDKHVSMRKVDIKLTPCNNQEANSRHTQYFDI